MAARKPRKFRRFTTRVSVFHVMCTHCGAAESFGLSVDGGQDLREDWIEEHVCD